MEVLLYYIIMKNNWHISSSSIPDGSGTITKGLTFAELFWDIWNNICKYTLPKNKNLTYMFELFTPRNTIVVKPDREAILLHGARDIETYNELDPKVIALENEWEFVPEYKFNGVEEVIEKANNFNPATKEGFVVRDTQFNRVKIKSIQYVALSHLSIKGKLNVNARHMLQIVRCNEDSEFLSYFPEYEQLHQIIKEYYNRLVVNLEQELQQDQDIEKYSTQFQQFFL